MACDECDGEIPEMFKEDLPHLDPHREHRSVMGSVFYGVLNVLGACLFVPRLESTGLKFLIWLNRVWV